MMMLKQTVKAERRDEIPLSYDFMADKCLQNLEVSNTSLLAILSPARKHEASDYHTWRETASQLCFKAVVYVENNECDWEIYVCRSISMLSGYTVLSDYSLLSKNTGQRQGGYLLEQRH